jgi:Zn-dependent membrane protease YugP
MSAGIIIISLLFMGQGLIVQGRLKSKFSAYSKVPTSSGLSGKEVAEKMLHDNGIFDVSIVSVQGVLKRSL